jgi:WD40 repeat protein
MEPLRRNRHDVCMAISHDDKYIAISLNERVYVYQANIGRIRRVHLLNEMEAYRVHQRNPQSAPLNHPIRPMNWRELSQEARNQNALLERKLSFSPDGKNLIIATHLADQHVYLDVWDCETEPWTIRTGHSRSVKLPPVSGMALNPPQDSFLSFSQSLTCPSISRTMGILPVYSMIPPTARRS